jgi:anthranilate synthase/aminodeoxychorismate synthase-like glutamine amidotransferase
MVVLIDNYDSFVYNLARYVGQLGYRRLVFRNDAILIGQLAALQPSHIIISPGPRTPNEAGVSLKVIEYFAEKIPILGVCLGHQAIGQAFGGCVVKASRPMYGMSCKIQHHRQGILKNLNNPLEVARYHSLVVARESLPSCLEITAYSDEGEIMALQHKTYPTYGVQFHPESILTEQGYDLIQNFLETDVHLCELYKTL